MVGPPLQTLCLGQGRSIGRPRRAAVGVSAHSAGRGSEPFIDREHTRSATLWYRPFGQLSRTIRRVDPPIAQLATAEWPRIIEPNRPDLRRPAAPSLKDGSSHSREQSLPCGAPVASGLGIVCCKVISFPQPARALVSRPERGAIHRSVVEASGSDALAGPEASSCTGG
jgi:hypothetical protein